MPRETAGSGTARPQVEGGFRGAGRGTWCGTLVGVSLFVFDATVFSQSGQPRQPTH